MIYLRENIKTYNLKPTHSFADSSNNILTVQFSYNNQKCLITCVYRAPSEDHLSFQKSYEGILNHISRTGIKSIISGDFNYNLFNTNYHKETGNYFDTMIALGYHPKVTQATRITEHSCTLLDHIWLNNESDASEDLKDKSYILVTDITDHLPVLYCPDS